MEHITIIKEYAFSIKALLQQSKHTKILEALSISVGFKSYQEYLVKFQNGPNGLFMDKFYEYLYITREKLNENEQALTFNLKFFYNDLSCLTIGQKKPILIKDYEEGYRLAYPEFIESHMDDLWELENQYSNGNITKKNVLERLNKIIDSTNCLYIDALRFRGNLYYDTKSSYSKAKADYNKAFIVAQNAIPKSFLLLKDKVSWSIMQNRDFIRAYWCWADLLMNEEKYKEAAIIFEQIISFHPNDNTGSRYMLLMCLLHIDPSRVLLLLNNKTYFDYDYDGIMIFAETLAHYMLDNKQQYKILIKRICREYNEFCTGFLHAPNKPTLKKGEFWKQPASDAFDLWDHTKSLWSGRGILHELEMEFFLVEHQKRL